MSDLPIREQPLSRYRITIAGDRATQAEIRYTDCRHTAEWYYEIAGRKVEAHVYGIGWQPIEKVVP
jgi:hypothetical protein